MRIKCTLHAPIDRVWDAWTKPEQIAKWWGPAGFTNTIHTMDVIEGGEWKFIMHGPDGVNYPNRSVYHEIVPQEKIIFQHFDPNFLTTVVFESQGPETFMDWEGEFETVELYQALVKAVGADAKLKENVDKLEQFLKQ